MDNPNVKDALCILADASYEYHKEMGVLAKTCLAKTNEEVAGKLDEAISALDEQKHALQTLTAQLRGS